MKVLTKAAQVAKLIKEDLKKLGVKCKVKSQNFAGGNSVDVYLHDIKPGLFKQILERYKKYEYGQFDIATDAYEYNNLNKNIPQVKYLFIHNFISPRLQQCFDEFIFKNYGLKFDKNKPSSYYSIALNETRENSQFWEQYPEFNTKQPKTCPLCGSIDMIYPALSRTDNKTEICPKCGQIQALTKLNVYTISGGKENEN